MKTVWNNCMYSILQCSANILYTDFTNKLLVSESDAVRLRFCGRRVCIQCTDVKRYFCIHIASLIILHEKHRVVNVTLRAAPCRNVTLHVTDTVQTVFLHTCKHGLKTWTTLHAVAVLSRAAPLRGAPRVCEMPVTFSADSVGEDVREAERRTVESKQIYRESEDQIRSDLIGGEGVFGRGTSTFQTSPRRHKRRQRELEAWVSTSARSWGLSLSVFSPCVDLLCYSYNRVCVCARAYVECSLFNYVYIYANATCWGHAHSHYHAHCWRMKMEQQLGKSFVILWSVHFHFQSKLCIGQGPLM